MITSKRKRKRKKEIIWWGEEGRGGIWPWFALVGCS